VLFLNVHELELRKVRFSLSMAPGQVDLLDQRLRQAGSLEVSGGAEIAGSLGEIGDFDLLYQPDVEAEGGQEREISTDDADVGFYSGSGIELVDVIREQILLWLPMHPVCRDDCQGICPVCGQNRNSQPCRCHEEAVDDRWLALKKLRS
jgi:uncharacterized protein